MDWKVKIHFVAMQQYKQSNIVKSLEKGKFFIFEVSASSAITSKSKALKR